MSPYTGGGGYLPTQWWISGSTIDLKFTTSQYYDAGAGGDGQAVTSYLSCSRASTGTAKNSSGVWVSFSSNVLRITDLGLTSEDAHTNFLLNSGAPVTQTTGSLSSTGGYLSGGKYCLWVEGTGSATTSAGTATITGAGTATAGSPNVFTVTVSGTVVVTVSGTVTLFQLEDNQVPSSYIPTTGATVTRAQDVISVLGNALTILTNFPMSGLFDVQLADSSPGNSSVLLGKAPAGSFPMVYRENANNTNFDFGGTAGGSGPAALLGGGKTFTGGAKVGFSQDGAGMSLVGGGGTVATDATHELVWNNPLLASNTASSFLNLNGQMRRWTSWNSRLADVTLQGLTS